MVEQTWNLDAYYAWIEEQEEMKIESQRIFMQAKKQWLWEILKVKEL